MSVLDRVISPAKKPKGRPEIGYIYFIASADGPVKIGRAVNVEQRLASLQTAHWEKLHLIEAIHCDMRAEKLIQHYFRDRHLAREWFRHCWAMDILIEEIDQFRDHFMVGYENPITYEDVEFILKTFEEPWVSRWPEDRR